MDFTQSGLWQKTLAQRTPDGHDEPRERLRASFLQFRQHVEPLAAEVSQSVPGYTDHSIEHCDALWDTASLIAGEAYPLNPAEAFVLGGSFLVHDLAMGLAAYSEGLPGILATAAWRDLLWAQWPRQASELQEQALVDVERNPTWDGLTSLEVKSSLTVFLRESHAAEAEDILAREWKLSSNEPFFLLPDTELRHWYGEVIGKIARSHWQDVLELEESLPGTLGAPSGIPLDWTVDPVKIACILRLADASQIDSRRAHPLHTPHRNPQGDSRDHWIFQERMLHPRLDESRLEFTSARAFRPIEADAWWLAYDTVAMIHRELQGVDSLCADLGKPRMEARGAAGAEDPKRFARYVPTTQWSPIDARPHIENPLGIISALGGEALYGNRSTVPLRELLANAVDASRARKAAQGEHGIVPPVRVAFERTEESDRLLVRDFGIGMSAETIVDYLCNFGTSGWSASSFRQEYPGALSSGYKSTGQFGIGFFSVFMLGSRVRVVSRPLHGGWDDTHVLEFTNGIFSRPILRKAEAGQRLSEPGTEVTVWLDSKFDDVNGLLFADIPMDELQQMQVIQRLAFTSDQAIEFIPMYSDVASIAVDGKPWSDRSPTQIYDVMHSDPWLVRTSETAREGEDFFEQSLTPLYGNNESVVGLLAFNARDRRDWLAPASCYCGGFQSANLYELTGVAIGHPVRASRDRVRLDVSIDQMQHWVRTQLERSDRLSNFSDSDKLALHWFALGFGVELDERSMAITKDGPATTAEIVEWIAGRNEFLIAQIAVQNIVKLNDENLWLNSYEGIYRLEEGTIGVGFGRRRYDDEFPMPDCPEIGELIGAGLHPQSLRWWLNNQYDPEGAVLRAAVRAWDVSLADLLGNVMSAGVVGDVDNRPRLVVYEGDDLRAPGLIVSKPT